jgi:hypothetical protein
MPLTKEQLEEFDDWLSSRGEEFAACPRCGKAKFTTPELVAMPILTPVPDPQRPAFTAIVLPCGECGLVRLFSPSMFGVIPPRAGWGNPRP